MYAKFTDRARRVLLLANEEALRFDHEYIGTEHILLALVREGSGVAASVLKNLDIDLGKIRHEVEKIVPPGLNALTMEKLPLTPRAKKVIEYSIEESRKLNHNYVGTEHILLGVLREQEGVAGQVLINLGLKLEDVRSEVLQLLGQPWGAKSVSRRRCGRPAMECDLYLPLGSSDGALVDPEKIARVQRQIHEQFGGVLRFPQEQEGVWHVGGVNFRGKVIVLRVVAEPGDKTRSFFERLKEDLKAELRQDDILILIRDIEIL